MAACEGNNIARRLRKRGWTITLNTKQHAYSATHPDTDAVLWWKARSANPQRLFDEAAAALGCAPRTTSGHSRKAKRISERQRQLSEEQQRETARQAITQRLDAGVTNGARPHDELNGVDAKALAMASRHAIERAGLRGITATMIMDSLRYPRYVRPGGKPGQRRYDGATCCVVIDDRNVIVTVFRNADQVRLLHKTTRTTEC